ncbi:MAG: alpha/beta hydrolase [Alphaproteobacteria bacterium]
MPSSHDLTRRHMLTRAAGAACLPLLSPMALSAATVSAVSGAAWAQETDALDPASAAVNAFLAGPGTLPLHQKTLGSIRADLEEAGQTFGAEPIPMADRRDTDVPLSDNRTPVRIYRPLNAGDGPPPILIYVHGGYFVGGSIDSHDHVARSLARACGAMVASIGYRRAPEHPYPAALDDVSEALRWLADKGDVLGGDKTRMGLVGDDAGGMLAASTAIRFRRQPFEGLKFLGLMTPYLRLDDETDFPSRSTYGSGGYRPSLADLAWMRDRYLSLEEDETPSGLVSPLQASAFKGVPTTLVITAGQDAVRDEAGYFVRRLRENGVVSGERRFDDTIHDFMFYAPLIPAGAIAFDVLAAQFRQALTP